METFDPRTITGGDWPGIRNLVTLLWLLVIFNVGFAAAMLFGHILIPSFTATAHISARFHNFRPILYILGFMSLGVAIYVVGSWLIGLGVIYDVYPKRLI